MRQSVRQEPRNLKQAVAESISWPSTRPRHTWVWAAHVASSVTLNTGNSERDTNSCPASFTAPPFSHTLLLCRRPWGSLAPLLIARHLSLLTYNFLLLPHSPISSRQGGVRQHSRQLFEAHDTGPLWCLAAPAAASAACRLARASWRAGCLTDIAQHG